MPVNINGLTGVTTPGLASDGMPTSGGDAVVESGSNSDGEWTKWADGTQQCFLVGLATADVSGAANGFYYRAFYWTFPVPFISQPVSTLGARSTGKVTPTATTDPTDTLTDAASFIVSGTALSSATYTTRWFATGRWK